MFSVGLVTLPQGGSTRRSLRTARISSPGWDGPMACPSWPCGHTPRGSPRSPQGQRMRQNTDSKAEDAPSRCIPRPVPIRACLSSADARPILRALAVAFPRRYAFGGRIAIALTSTR